MQLGCGLQAAGMLMQEKVLRGQTQALTWSAEAESKREGPKGDGRCSLGCGLQAAGMLKQEEELRGQTQALTWTAEAESKRDRKETDGAAWAVGFRLRPCQSRRQSCGGRRTVQLGAAGAAVAAAACVVALPLPNR